MFGVLFPTLPANLCPTRSANCNWVLIIPCLHPLVRCLPAISVAPRYGDQARHGRPAAAEAVPPPGGQCQGRGTAGVLQSLQRPAQGVPALQVRRPCPRPRPRQGRQEDAPGAGAAHASVHRRDAGR